MQESIHRNLSFRDPSIEKDFKLSRQSYNLKCFKLRMLWTVVFSITTYFSGILGFHNLDFLPIILFISSLFFYMVFYITVSRKCPQHSSTAIIISVILKIIIICELIKFIQKKGESSQWIYFSAGLLIEIECLSLIICRIKWNFYLSVTTLGQIYTWLRFKNFGAQPEAITQPFILLTISSFMFCILSYFNEKQERIDFQNLHEHNNHLKAFEDLIRRVIPSSIVLVKNEEILLVNDKTKKIFGIGSELEGKEILRSVKIVKRLKYPTNFIFSKSIIQENKRERCYQSSLLELINDWDFSMSFLDNNLTEGFCNLEGDFMAPNEENNKFFLIKIGQIVWRGSNCVIVIFNDYTAIKKNYQRLGAHKDSLLATISHELKTPLNGIMGMMDMVIEETLEQNTREKLKIATLSGKLLFSMINNIIDFFLFSNGKLRLKREQTNVRLLIDECVKIYSVHAAENNIDIYFENNLTFENEIQLIDGPRLSQILLNLVGNAIKFTKAGWIKIRVRVEGLSKESVPKVYDEIIELDKIENLRLVDCADEYSFNKLSRKRLLIEVEDTGSGIEQDEIEKLFELFQDNSNENNEDNTIGTGLGLKISQILVSLMNSNDSEEGIRVISEVGTGSKFTFPIYLDEKPEDFILEKEFKITDFQKHYPTRIKSNCLFDRNGSSNPSPLITENENFIFKDNTPINVLAVDDDSINLIVVRSYLKKIRRMFKLITASDGKEALEIVNENAKKSEFFDIFLMDCNMPIMDGYEASENLKKMMKADLIPWAPIVAITANVGTADEVKCLAKGMDYFLAKPYKKIQLSRILEKALHTNLEDSVEY